MNHLEQIEKNAKLIKACIGVLILLGALIYGACIFVYQSKQCNERVLTLQTYMAEMEARNTAKHKEIDNRITQNEKSFQMTSAKLDVSLIEIRSDLKFIKEHLMRKGLDK